ncbi:hypothetical protein [Shewanella woodyi]|uniref:Uncharacterized protein n=1 Tax=Shewanella woodyi (strain ATCC 51908 / MS32) TaxID=392500 RepID=B1KFI1_SHEWM|nr:hypothetical protein [Shewanella woodyi]ACA88156.1 hypothetical protein Swoo_3898 [Shewanella woodyi ATCC 51908]
MNNIELSESGNKLAEEIDRLACDYHIKSDQHEILKWEASILWAKSKDLIEDCGLLETLKDSTLLSKWGSYLVKEIPEVAIKVEEFHQHYNRIKSR